VLYWLEAEITTKAQQLDPGDWRVRPLLLSFEYE
jgi:hypothetical protein